jgi:hypothetical protein
MSFSVKGEEEDFEYSGTPRGLFCQARNLLSPRFQRMIVDLLRFNRELRRLLEGEDREESLGDFISRHGFSRWFVERLIVPQVSAVWSADPLQMRSFPVRFMAEFFANHGMLGFRDRVTVLLEDYRALEGRYDKLVSIEMIEAVGWQYFPTFFRRCSELVTDDGAMLLQGDRDRRPRLPRGEGGRSFINTHIFPGGCLPSMEVISRSLARVTDFRQVHLEDITEHYATTLARWRERFLAAADRLPELGYDERFRRLWDLYLSYCEGGFRERRIQDVQLLLAKPRFP